MMVIDSDTEAEHPVAGSVSVSETVPLNAGFSAGSNVTEILDPLDGPIMVPPVTDQEY